MSVELRYPNGQPFWHTGEEVPFVVDAAEWTTTPTSPSIVEVIDETSQTDVVSTVMPSGSPSVTNALITLPLFKLATAGKSYRIEVQFTGDNSSVLRGHIRVDARA